MIISNVKIGEKTITLADNKTIKNVVLGNNSYKHAEYVDLTNGKAVNSVSEPLRFKRFEGYHSKNEVGSHYTFYGSSEVVKSENLANLPNPVNMAGWCNDTKDYQETYTNNPPSQSANNVDNSVTGLNVNKTYYVKATIKRVTTGTSSQAVFYIGHNANGYLMVATAYAINPDETISIHFTITGYDSIRISLWDNTSYLTVSNLIVSETDTTYTPYFEPYIKNKGVRGKWVEISNVFKANTYSSVVYFRFSKPNNSVDRAKATTSIYCEKYEPNNATYNWDDVSKVGKIFGGADYLYYWVCFPLGTTLEQAQSQLNGIMLWYETTDTTADYFITDLGTPICIGTEPLRQGDTYCTDGVRKTKVASESIVNGALSQTLLSTPTTSVGQAYSLDSGLSGDNLCNIGNISGKTSLFIARCKSGTYTFSAKSNENIRYYIYTSNIQSPITSNSYLTSITTFTLDNESDVNIYMWNGSAYEITDIMLNEGSTAKAYTPFIASETPRYALDYGNVPSIKVGDTTTSLNLNILQNGVLDGNVLENEYGIVNAWDDSVVWRYNTSWGAKSSFYADGIVRDNNIDLVCDIYSITSASNIYANGIEMTIANNGNFVRVCDTRFTDVATFKQYLQANQVKIIYKLASKKTTTLSLPSTPTATETNVLCNVPVQYAKQI